jgi:hypothetical protein
LLSFTRSLFRIVEAFNIRSGYFLMDLNTILFAVVMVGVAGFIIFEAVKSISEEFNF